jgi:hypothetical protein
MLCMIEGVPELLLRVILIEVLLLVVTRKLMGSLNSGVIVTVEKYGYFLLPILTTSRNCCIVSARYLRLSLLVNQSIFSDCIDDAWECSLIDSVIYI